MAKETFRVWFKGVPDFGKIGVQFDLELSDGLSEAGRLKVIHGKAGTLTIRLGGKVFWIEKKAEDGEWDTIAAELA